MSSDLMCYLFSPGIPGNGGWWRKHSRGIMGECVQHAASGENSTLLTLSMCAVT